MIPYTATFNVLVADFERAGIDLTQPGFYDDPLFQAREAENPIYLNNYARFVRGRQYDAAYLAKAERVIKKVADVLAVELVRDGRLGACVDLNMVFSRILEREGIWNHMVKGALTVKDSAGTVASFPPIDSGEFAAGHVWLFAPPFDVVDITIKQQPYDSSVKQQISSTILEKQVTPMAVRPEDVCADEVLRYFALQGVPPSRALFVAAPQLREFLPLFPANLITRGNLFYRYVPVAVSASDGPLERITNYPMNGRFGVQIYEESIRPALDALTDD